MSMKETTKMTKKTVMVFSDGPLAVGSKATSRMTIDMDLALCIGLMEPHTRASGIMECRMEKAS